jgi:hypothetical protein
MNETRFRNLINGAIGDEPAPPWLAAKVRGRLLAPTGNQMRGRVMLAIAAMAILLIAGLVEQQIVTRRSAVITVPAATPSATPAPSPVAALDPSNCRLPVVVERGSGPPTQLATEVGFVDTRTGLYTKDDSASVAGLPVSSPPWGPVDKGSAAYYSWALHRWLPVGAPQIAPDGRSYAWVQTLPVGVAPTNYTSSQLHRYDVATATDHLLWTYGGAIAIVRWDVGGILVNAGPVQGDSPSQVWLLIDPMTGVAAPHAPPQSYVFRPFKPLPSDPHEADVTSLGWNAEGDTIWWILNLDKPGAVNWVFYETAPGQRVTIYRGTQGDSTGFDPNGGALADSTGIWFADNVHHTIWHWQQDVGLHKTTITGLPANLSGANAYVQVSPAGPCF